MIPKNVIEIHYDKNENIWYDGHRLYLSKKSIWTKAKASDKKKKYKMACFDPVLGTHWFLFEEIVVDWKSELSIWDSF